MGSVWGGAVRAVVGRVRQGGGGCGRGCFRGWAGWMKCVSHLWLGVGRRDCMLGASTHAMWDGVCAWGVVAVLWPTLASLKQNCRLPSFTLTLTRVPVLMVVQAGSVGHPVSVLLGHTAPVTFLDWGRSRGGGGGRHVLVSSSYDGTCRWVGVRGERVWVCEDVCCVC